MQWCARVLYELDALLAAENHCLFCRWAYRKPYLARCLLLLPVFKKAKLVLHYFWAAKWAGGYIRDLNEASFLQIWFENWVGFKNCIIQVGDAVLVKKDKGQSIIYKFSIFMLVVYVLQLENILKSTFGALGLKVYFWTISRFLRSYLGPL